MKEGVLDDMNTEFPIINQEFLGRKGRYSYNVHMDVSYTLTFDGLVKYDTWTGKYEKYMFGPHQYGNEAAFAPRFHAKSEDDGYVLTYIYDKEKDRSELIIIDALHFEDGPIARVAIPQRVPMGFHATWVDGKKLYANE